MRYFWGLLLVCVGSAYLSASLGYINYNQINQLWFWWPLILVFIGFDLLLKRFKYGWVGMIALTLLAGLAVYDISFAPKSYINPSNRYTNVSREVKESKLIIEKDENAKTAEIVVKTGVVEFNISGSNSNLIDGNLLSNFAELTSKNNLLDNVQKIELSTESFMRPMMMWFGGNIKNNLTLSFNDKLPILLKIESGASKLDFDLSKYIISGVDINSGASKIDLTLGDKVIDGAKILVDSGASTINISVPKKVGVRIKSETGLVTKNYEGFTLNGDYYENEAYKSADKKIEIELRAGASTLNVSEY